MTSRALWIHKDASEAQTPGKPSLLPAANVHDKAGVFTLGTKLVRFGRSGLFACLIVIYCTLVLVPQLRASGKDVMIRVKAAHSAASNSICRESHLILFQGWVGLGWVSEGFFLLWRKSLVNCLFFFPVWVCASCRVFGSGFLV